MRICTILTVIAEIDLNKSDWTLDNLHNSNNESILVLSKIQPCPTHPQIAKFRDFLKKYVYEYDKLIIQMKFRLIYVSMGICQL